MRTDRDILAWVLAFFAHMIPVLTIAFGIAFLAGAGRHAVKVETFSEGVYRLHDMHCAKHKRWCK